MAKVRTADKERQISRKGRRIGSEQDGEAIASTSSHVPRSMGAFRTLRIGPHHISYMRKHDGDDDRTMFLVNLPTDSTDRHIRGLFQSAGPIESIRLWKPMGVIKRQEAEEEATLAREAANVAGKAAAPAIVPLPPLDPRHPHPLLPTATSAHVTFLDESSLQRALEMTSIKAWPDPFKKIGSARHRMSLGEGENGHSNYKVKSAEEAMVASASDGTASVIPPLGLDYLFARHRSLRPSLEAVGAYADSVIANFAWRKAHPSKLGKDGAGGIEAVSVGPDGELLDADGFVIVQRTGKYGRATDGTQGGAGGMRIARTKAPVPGEQGGDDEGDQASQPAKKKKRMELEDFYRFQRREVKRQELADLRAKFQADQEKVKKLKAKRSFKPF